MICCRCLICSSLALQIALSRCDSSSSRLAELGGAFAGVVLQNPLFAGVVCSFVPCKFGTFSCNTPERQRLYTDARKADCTTF